MPIEKEVTHFRHLADEWQTTLAEVRELEGFQDFLRPSRLSTLQSAATNGAVTGRPERESSWLRRISINFNWRSAYPVSRLEFHTGDHARQAYTSCRGAWRWRSLGSPVNLRACRGSCSADAVPV
jgi:hypothetical protein